MNTKATQFRQWGPILHPTLAQRYKEQGDMKTKARESKNSHCLGQNSRIAPNTGEQSRIKCQARWQRTKARLRPARQHGPEHGCKVPSPGEKTPPRSCCPFSPAFSLTDHSTAKALGSLDFRGSPRTLAGSEEGERSGDPWCRPLGRIHVSH